MPDKCGVCNAEIDHISGQKCVGCEATFHLDCVKGLSGTKVPRKNWKCDKCLPAATSIGKSGSDNEPILAAIAEFRRETNTRLQGMEAALLKLTAVEEEIKQTKTELGELKTQVDEDRKQQEETASSVAQLTSENRKLIQELNKVKKSVADLQQHTRKNNIIISGVPVSRNENIYDILEGIAGLLNIRYGRYDISVAHRLSPRPESKNPPSIVVNFLSRSIKDYWLEARRRRWKLSARELNPNFPDTQVFLNEHLTQETQGLFNAARALRPKRFASVWTSDGRVIVKTTMTGRPFRIWDLNHLERLENAALRREQEPDHDNQEPGHHTTTPRRDTPGSSHEDSTTTT